MSNKRDLRLWKYGISVERYRELSHWCRQYDEWRSKSNYGLTAIVNDGMPHAKGSVSNPTEAQALRNAKYIDNINCLETTAQEADEFIYKYLIMNVTRGRTFEEMRVPCGRRQFYESRRKFFYILDLKRP